LTLTEIEPFGDVGRPEQLGLDLTCERHVVVVAPAGHGRGGAVDGALRAARGLAPVDLGEHEGDRGGEADRARDPARPLGGQGPAARLAPDGV
jgi:hypothetical protein